MKKNKILLSIITPTLNNQKDINFFLKLVKKQKINRFKLLNLLTIILFLLLPYYLFHGKLYIGGDDTRLMYVFPVEYFKNAVLFSWSNISEVGVNSPAQFWVPFLAIWSTLSSVISSRVVLDYLSFSLPLIISLIYFQKFVGELINNRGLYYLEIFAGALFFILSPILIIDQLFIFLSTVWLLGLIFILSYYFIRYLKTSSFSYIFKSIAWSTFLSMSIISISWILGYMIPLFLGLIIVSMFFSKTRILLFIKKFIFFFGLIALSQSFWLLSFIMSFVNIDLNSPVGKLAHPEYLSSFAPTVLSTAVGNIFYPLLNIFHRQIAFNFEWKLKDVFMSFYDTTFVLNAVFVIVLFFGFINFKKFLKKEEKNIFLLFAISFVSSLYLFTVNIGPLKNLFLNFGYIPGFVMFRNFYDKFAPAYVISYSILITLCLIVIRRKSIKLNRLLLPLVILVILINFIPVKSIVNSALWTTKNIYKTVTIPDEYLNSMAYIKQNIAPTNNILSFPLGTAIYTVIKDESSSNAYVGVSPVKIFSGVNDISGLMSFNFTKEADAVYNMIIGSDSIGLNKLLYSHNINYVFVTKNIPEQVKKSYIYDKTMLNAQNDNFLKKITGKKIFTSSNGNYELYATKLKNILLKSDNLYFQKINQTKYKLLIKNLKKSQELDFNDSFNSGWKLYISYPHDNFLCKQIYKQQDSNTTECRSNFKIYEGEELSYVWKKPIFEDSHSTLDGFANKWVIDPEFIKKNFDKSLYTENKDGSINVEMVMYFKPQTYFYLGILISFLVVILSFSYLVNDFLKLKNEKNNFKNRNSNFRWRFN